VWRGGRAVRRIEVAIGAPSSPTPTGRFAVAEKLPGSEVGAAYGCCVLGLTAHQPHPPAGWNPHQAYYVAIHGGDGIGEDASAGCLHASEPDLRYLMRTIPLGTAITIRR
jgi:lipoprotein-anchoring transpeptidase ErfK/SrfK